MGLTVKCGELGSLDADTKAFMCATEEGAAACPSTCTGDCACMDDKDASFTKKELPPALVPAPVTVPAWTIKMLHLQRRMVKKELPPALVPAPVTVPAWTIKMLHLQR